MLEQMLAALAKLGGARFVNLIYTTKETGEVGKYSLILGASTEELYRKDIVKLNRVCNLLAVIGALPHTRLAAEELLASRMKSLEVGIGNNPEYTNADTYMHLNGFPGVSMHKETGALYVRGLVQHKTVLQEGKPRKVVNSSPKTIAKRKLEKMLPSGRFRLFVLGNVTRAALNGTVLELQ